MDGANAKPGSLCTTAGNGPPRSTTSEQGVWGPHRQRQPLGAEAGHLATHLASAEQGKHRLRPILARAYLNAVALSVAMRVFLQQHVTHPMPTVLDRPPLPDMTQKGLGSGAQA